MKKHKKGDFFLVKDIKQSTRKIVIPDIDNLSLESQIILWELQNAKIYD
jgi:hypothetical protein